MEEKDLVNTSGDSVKISDEVISVITGIAASETEGVASVGVGSIASSWAELISGKKGKNPSKGIKAELTETGVNIEIQIVVKYGVSIPEVASNVQYGVKNAVEEMTGLTVEKVDVKVVGIKTVAEEKKAEKKEETEEKE
ncbi:MAG: Asp23/Gls24 family envelope stress response protein [Clostridia bacterium]|nr:Asp23/Gls24 family envelope stress response protein [Clostridia bacterium]